MENKLENAISEELIAYSKYRFNPLKIGGVNGNADIRPGGLLVKKIADRVRGINPGHVEARLDELSEMKKHMISTSPFIDQILQPRIDVLESKLSELEREHKIGEDGE